MKVESNVITVSMSVQVIYLLNITLLYNLIKSSFSNFSSSMVTCTIPIRRQKLFHICYKLKEVLNCFMLYQRILTRNEAIFHNPIRSIEEILFVHNFFKLYELPFFREMSILFQIEQKYQWFFVDPLKNHSFHSLSQLTLIFGH
ncbi:hypothetical protein V1478_006838 [Vespula squamosa]|uniref:Maturase K n=1 Tax=Vespula squamosa TaxID=30214 RepID=A0ABD2B1H0_VESSQ